MQPPLSRALRSAGFNFWVIRVKHPLQTMDDRYCLPDDHCTRILLKDVVILLTEDMLGDLKGTAILLQWIRNKEKLKAHSVAHHIMLHPGVMEWIERRLDDDRFLKDHAL